MIEVKATGLEETIANIQRYKQQLIDKTYVFLERLGELGLDVSRAYFDKAQYDGTNDISVGVEFITANKMRLIASGRTVLFVEFGTGIYQPEHPDADKLGMKHGSYGKGNGLKRAWDYYGEPGTNGIIIGVSQEKGPNILTYGNPPAMAMYKANDQMIMNIERIAKEVFQ